MGRCINPFLHPVLGKMNIKFAPVPVNLKKCKFATAKSPVLGRKSKMF